MGSVEQRNCPVRRKRLSLAAFAILHGYALLPQNFRLRPCTGTGQTFYKQLVFIAKINASYHAGMKLYHFNLQRLNI